MLRQRFGGLKPMQNFDKYKARAVGPYLDRCPVCPCRECSPRSRLLAFVQGSIAA